MALRTDNNAEWERSPWLGRYYVRLSKRAVSHSRWKRKDYDSIQAAQAGNPVLPLVKGKKRLWYFQDCFYWDDDGQYVEDVKALSIQHVRRLQKKLQSARSLM